MESEGLCHALYKSLHGVSFGLSCHSFMFNFICHTQTSTRLILVPESEGRCDGHEPPPTDPLAKFRKGVRTPSSFRLWTRLWSTVVVMLALLTAGAQAVCHFHSARRRLGTPKHWPPYVKRSGSRHLLLTAYVWPPGYNCNRWAATTKRLSGAVYWRFYFHGFYVSVFKYAIIMLIIGQCSTLHCCFCVILCFIMLLLLL